MILVLSCSCICPSHWSQVLSREWKCRLSSADTMLQLHLSNQQVYFLVSSTLYYKFDGRCSLNQGSALIITQVIILLFQEQIIELISPWSLVRSDTICQHRIWSTLVQVMACYLKAPSLYLNQCWLIISSSVAFTWEQFHSQWCSYYSV